MTPSHGNRASSAAERIAAEVRQRIKSGAYEAHAYLPSVRLLAEELSASCSTVSAALVQLAREGLVTHSRGRGTLVLPSQEVRSDTLVGLVTQHADIHATGSQRHQPMIEGICDALTARELPFEPYYVRSDQRYTEELLERFSALICVQAFRENEQLLEIDAKRFPLVVADLETDLPLTGTWVDRAKTTRRAVDTLVAMGHRRIAWIGVNTTRYFFPRAKKAFLAAMETHGLPFDEAYLAEIEKPEDVLAAYFESKRLLNLPDPPTAVIATRDYQAKGVCAAVEEAGLTVGNDVSVIGFDDLTWPLERPFLTTFREPCYELGYAAVEMLHDRIRNGWRKPELREIEAPFVLRESAGPPLRSRERLTELVRGGQ